MTKSPTDHAESPKPKATEAELLEVFRAMHEFAIIAVKSAILLNGAAAIALLTFVGNLGLVEIDFEKEQEFSTAFLCFAWGAFIAAACSVLGFLVNLGLIGSETGDSDSVKKTMAHITGKVMYASAAAILAAFAMFGFGLRTSWRAIFLL